MTESHELRAAAPAMALLPPGRRARLRAWSNGARLDQPGIEALAVLLLAPVLLMVPLWNGFPVIFYDTGAYLAQGLLGEYYPERSAFYSIFLLLTGAKISLWLVAWVQAMMTAFVLVQFARVDAPRTTLATVLGIGAILSLTTGMGWYVGQIEPDCMAAVTLVGMYVLATGAKKMGRARTAILLAVTAVAMAAHPSHLGLGAGLAGVAILAALLRRRMGSILPRVWPSRPLLAFAVSLVLVVASNFVYTQSLFVSRTGSVFVFARMMQDGIVQRLFDDVCPDDARAPAPYRLCAYRDRLETRADGWLWGPGSIFRDIGGFPGTAEESARIVRDALVRYPLMNLRAALTATVTQMFKYATGDQIEPQQWVLHREFLRMIPDQIDEYLAARQQHAPLRFAMVNRVHLAVGTASLAALLLALFMSRRRGDGQGVFLAWFFVLGLVGNAFICGALSNPHDRYQSRLIWVPTFVILTSRRAFALQRPTDYGT